MQITIRNPNGLPTINYNVPKPLQHNLKDLSEANAERLKNVLERRGFTQPMNLWKKGDEFYILDSHQRQRVMKAFDMNDNGNYEVPYFLTEAKDEQEAKMQILEISSQYGTITQEGFDEFAVELPEAELPDVYFDALFHDKSEPEVEEDEPPEVTEGEPESKLGEIYQLGRHRLMCGDSTAKENIEKLMDKTKADMVFTDPPYGMFLDADYSDMVGIGRGNKYENVKGDHEDFKPEFISTVFDNFGYCKEIFIWGADYFAELIPQRNKGAFIVWDKMQGGEGVNDNYDKMFGSNFELCWSKARHKRAIARVLWKGIFGLSEEDTKGREHPTQKPTKLCSWFLTKFTKEHNTVVDIYGGAGSTLIACEQLDRICYMIELDPKYCDVIRKRYWKFIDDGNEEGWQNGTPIIT